MNSYYKQPVIVFGLVAPVVLVLLVLALGIKFRGKFEATYKQRKSEYVHWQKAKEQREALITKINKQEPHMNRWMAVFNKATASSVNAFLSEVQKRYDSQELQLTAFRRGNKSGGIGGASKQPSIQIQLSFRGTYRALQNTFLELETLMPHLQLDSIKLNNNTTNRSVLTADLIYTAWQKE